MENGSPLPSLPTTSTGLGIDLRTTFCSVAVFGHQNAYPEVIDKDLGTPLTPCHSPFAVYEKDVKDAEVAVVVTDTGNGIPLKHPGNTSFDIRRLISGIFEDPHIQKYQKLWPFDLVKIHGFVRFKVHGDPSISQTFATKLISHLKKTAEEKLGHSIDTAVVTVPAYFTDLHTELTKYACKKAGFRNIQFIVEPGDKDAAVERHFQTLTSNNGLNACLIHHFGGGTLDDHLIQKCSLASSPSSSSVSLASPQKDTQGVTAYAAVERTLFQNLIGALFNRSVKILDNTLKKSGFEKQEINDKVSFGAPSKIPKVQKTIQWTHKIEGFPSTSAHAAVAVGDKIYSIGGINYPVHPFYSNFWPIGMFVLDVQESEMGWTQVSIEHHKSIPNQICGHTAVVYKEWVIIFGGFDTKKGKPANSTFLFNPETRKWTKPNVSGNIPDACYNHTAVVLEDEMIVFGGIGGTNDLHSLNLETFVWSKIQIKGTFPPILSGHSATVYNDRFMLVFGGIDLSKRYLNTLMSFDFNNKTWTELVTIGTPPKKRGKHCAFMKNGLMYIFGGRHKKHTYLNELFSFNPGTFEWKEVVPIGDAPSPRGDAKCVVIDDQVFIFGGFCRIYYDVLLDDTTVLEI